MPGEYILVDGEPVEATDLEAWSEWCFGADGIKNRRIAYTQEGDVTVSTVFLGLDHGFDFIEHQAILFETMVFGGEFDKYQERYTTCQLALDGHQRCLEKVFGSPTQETGPSLDSLPLE